MRRNRESSITFACVALPVIRQWADGLRGRVILLAVYFALYRIFAVVPFIISGEMRVSMASVLGHVAAGRLAWLPTGRTVTGG